MRITTPNPAVRYALGVACALTFFATFAVGQPETNAQSLIHSVDAEASRAEVTRLLAAPTSPAGQALLNAIAAEPDASPRLFPLLAQRIAAASPSELPVLLPALGSFRSRDSVRLLARYLADDAAAPAAIAALTRLSARDDVPPSRDAWIAFAAQAAEMSDTQWRQSLIAALAKREHRASVERDAAVTRLVETLRALHLASTAQARPALLASMLRSDLAEVQHLGFELVGRELSASGAVDGPVGDAALDLLRSPDPAVRAQAAVIVRQLAPEGVAPRIAAALASETDSRAATDLLLAAARWPSSAAVPPVLHWLTQSGPVADAACEAARWLLRAGQLPTEDSGQVLNAVRAIPDDRLAPASIALLAALGADADRARLVPLLTATSGSVRQAAAEALLWQPAYTASILDAAASDPDLFDLAARSVLVNNPTTEQVLRLLRLPAPARDRVPPSLLAAANGLPADQLLSVANQATDPRIRVALLTILTAPTRVMSERADSSKLTAIATGALELADVQLTDQQPEAALTTLDEAPYIETTGDTGRLAGLRCAALLGTGRLGPARALTAPASAWLRGLSLAGASPNARAIINEIESRFSAALTPAQKAEVETVKASLPAEPVGPMPNESSAATPPK